MVLLPLLAQITRHLTSLSSPAFDDLVTTGTRVRTLALSLFATITISSFNTAYGISFDELTATQNVIALSGQLNADTKVAANALGGSRYVQATSNGAINTSGVVGGGNYAHSQDAITTGTTFVRWDGDTNSGLQPAGLGGLDLTKDGATAVKITVVASDSAFGQPITVQFTLYDATDSSGTLKRSRGSFTVNSGIAAATNFEIPFASFVGEGFMGGVDFKTVGAIEMLINGNASTSHDLALSFIGTNGNCVHVPVNGFIVDQCGVCNGDNSSCSDCLGVPNGPALPGVMCPSGQPGVCADGTWAGVPPNNCSCVPDKTPKTEICDELDNDCDGLIDEGFSKGVTCTVGVGACKNDGVNMCAPDGSKKCSVTPKAPSAEKCDNIDNDCDGQIDEDFDKGGSCSVGVGACQSTGVKLCNGSGTLDCSAVPGTPTVEICDGIDNDCDGEVDEGSPSAGPLVDQCGVCKGSGNTCLDCKGTPNGGASIDICGVCGGDGTSCLDCKGTVNGTAKNDECGVCGGDGTSCLQCSTYDQSKTLGTLDSGAKEQQIIVRGAVSLLRAIPAARKEAKFISQTLEQAQKLQVLNWTLSWTLPIIVTDCSVATSVCVTTSNTQILTSYRENNVRLRDLATAVVERIKRYRKGKLTARDNKILRLAEAQFQANLKLSQTVPENQFACAGSA